MISRTVLLICCLALGLGARAQEIQLGKTIRVGGRVDIAEPVPGSVIIAAGHVMLDAPVAENARIAGGHVELGHGAVIGEDASIAGGNVTVKGQIKRNLHLAGGHVLIDAVIGGDVSVAAGKLELGPNTRIAGKLRVVGGNFEQSAGAQVAGPVEHVRRHTRSHERTAGERFAHGWAWTLGLMLLAALIAGVLPGPSARMAAELRTRPWMTLLLGFIALTAIPIAAVLFMITIIGLPIGLLGLLGYAVLLLVGYVWLSVVIGGLVLERFSAETAARTAWRIGAAVLAMLVLALLVRVPIAGGFVKFLALAIGVGMIVAALFHRTAKPAAA